MRRQKTKLLLVLCFGVLAGACQTENVSIMVRALHPLDADCKVDSNAFVGKGSLNLNASSTYLLSVVMESVVLGEDIEGSGGRLLSSEKENRVVLTEWTREIFVYGAAGTSKRVFKESEPLSGILEPNADTQLVVPLSMLSPASAQALKGLLQQAAGASPGEGLPPPGMEAVVRFQMHGKLMNSGKKLETAPIDFPIFVYLGEPLPLCLEGQTLAPVGPCSLQGGQDSFVPICCELDPNSRKCKN